MSSLYVIRGRDQGKRFELNSPSMTIGRDSSNHIQLRDSEVSRRHAEVVQVGEEFAILDLESSNGTFVNQNAIDRFDLRSGDQVQIGSSTMIFTSSKAISRRDLSELVDIVSDEVDFEESQIISSLDSSFQKKAFPTSADDSKQVESGHLQVIYQMALALSHTVDLDELVQRILDLIFDWVQADRGCVMLVDPATEKLKPKCTAIRNPKMAEDQFQISKTILDFVMTRREGVLTSDAGRDDRWQAGASIVKMGVREAICVPMRGRYGIVGVLYIDTFTSPGKYISTENKDKFNSDHLKLMIAIGHQAALAIEDTNFYSAMLQSERLATMGQTIAMLSHHIKNILQGIQGGSYLIKQGLKNEQNEVVAKGWSLVEKNQDKISNLVMDMLSFSKEREPELALGDVNQVIDDIVELMQSRAAENQVAIDWHKDESISPAMVDTEGLHRAVLNVMTNAIDACRDIENAVVKIRVAEDELEGRLSIQIQDNGSGIPNEDLEKIFSIFESGKGNRGTGLGLAVSQKIMLEHGGDISVASQVGKGSRFTLWIPMETNENAVSKTFSM